MVRKLMIRADALINKGIVQSNKSVRRPLSDTVANTLMYFEKNIECIRTELLMVRFSEGEKLLTGVARKLIVHFAVELLEQTLQMCPSKLHQIFANWFELLGSVPIKLQCALPQGVSQFRFGLLFQWFP